MSFALTTEQIRQQTKTVTRRIGWRYLKPGSLLQPVVKSQGLKKGEKVEKIGGPIRVTSVRREQLTQLTGVEVLREGFPSMTCIEFTEFFCANHQVPDTLNPGKTRPCEPWDYVTRIEFEYTT